MEIKNKIPDATGFVTTFDFNRLTKIGFDVRMKKAAKSLPTESQLDTALNITDQNRNKK